MSWQAVKRLVLSHLRTGTDARVVLEGDTATVQKRPAILFADVDGGEAEFSVKGGVHYAKTLHMKVLGGNDDELEAVMKQVRRCWEKDAAAGTARIAALVSAGVLNIYPASSGEKSMPFAGDTKNEYEGLVTMTCHYRETA